MKTWQARDRRCLHACFVTQYSLLNIQYSPSAILTLHSSLYILDCFSSLPAERRAGIFDLISTLCLRGSPLSGDDESCPYTIGWVGNASPTPSPTSTTLVSPCLGGNLPIDLPLTQHHRKQHLLCTLPVTGGQLHELP